MAEKLTPQQQLAVDDRGGRLLVSAAAGSGKTKVLVDRLMKYMLDPVDPANIDEFLIITYTRAAASELRGKIASKLSEAIAGDPANRHLQRQLQRLYLAKISTVHSFCTDILREYAYRLDIAGDFRMAEENECLLIRTKAVEQVLEEAYGRIGEDEDVRAFVDTQGLGRTDDLVPEIIQKIYDSSRCHLDPEAWLDKCVSDADVADIADASQTVWGRYLMNDLFRLLDEQIAALERCAAAVGTLERQEKAAALLADTVDQLRHLRESRSWDQIIARKQIRYGTLTFTKATNDPSVTEPVKAVRNRCKALVGSRLDVFSDPSERILSDLAASTAAARGLVSLVRDFGELYEKLKRSRRILDFGDLEHKTLDLFTGRRRNTVTAIADSVGERFREIMVDEYQDSNGVQDAIFSALTQRRQNLFMVGDVKQSIYQFRLADPGIFLEKYNTYVPAEQAKPGQGRKVVLSSNFRSGGAVIDGVNSVFRLCMTERVGGLDYGDAEALVEGIPHEPLSEPEVCLHCIQVREDTYAEEAAFVAEKIASLTDGTHFIRGTDGPRPIRADDITILLRSPNSVGSDFRLALEQRGIRTATDGGVDLLRTEEIGTLRCLLQAISNPRQDIPLLSVLASPVFGFTANDLALLRTVDKSCGIYEALLASGMPKAQAFLDVLGQLRAAAGMEDLPGLLLRIFRLTRMDAVYSAMPDGQNRVGNLQSFFQTAVAFKSRDLEQFLAHLDASEDKGLMTAGEQANTGCVRITSIHKSKGLEYPVVFLCGLSRRFNQQSLTAQVQCDQDLGLGLSCVEAQKRVRYPTLSKHAIVSKARSDSISEELRVLYVAMTRARDRLIMTYASSDLEGDIADLTMRMDLTGQDALSADADCLGHWVLCGALRRVEAGALFAMGGRPSGLMVSELPWSITVEEAPQAAAQMPEEEVSAPSALSEGNLEDMRKALSFRYAHMGAVQTPSKQTATQLKGRVKDAEAQENTAPPRSAQRIWRAPSFAQRQTQGKEYGSAIHAVLHYADFSACTDADAVDREIARLVQERFITEEQGQLASREKLTRFFTGEMGRRIREGDNVLREFKFSILDDASRYGADLSGEQVLLQGVVDCALIEPDGITVLDFKTDYVTDETLGALCEKYRPQVETYAGALSRIFESPVKGTALYLFHLDRLCWL